MSKLCLVVLMVFTQLLDITQSDYASKYYNQVIYIETLTQRGHWLDAYHNGGARFTGSSQRDVINAVWAKWFVRPDPDGSGKIALESALYPNHYLDSHGGMSALVTHADYPYDKTWALWTLEDSPTGSFQVLHSVQNVDYYLTWFFGGGWVATYDDSAKLRVYQPTITESTSHVYTYNNSQGVDPVHTAHYIQRESWCVRHNFNNYLSYSYIEYRNSNGIHCLYVCVNHVVTNRKHHLVKGG